MNHHQVFFALKLLLTYLTNNEYPNSTLPASLNAQFSHPGANYKPAYTSYLPFPSTYEFCLLIRFKPD